MICLLQTRMKDIINYQLFKIGKLDLTISTLIIVAIIIISSWLFLFIVNKALHRSKKLDPGTRYAVYQLIRYFLLIIVISVILKLLGLDITVLVAGSAALLVGIGLGLQSLFTDFVSGLIILFDGSVKVGDIIEVNKTIAKVTAINIRTTTVLTRDDVTIIFPNSYLTNNEFINWTHNDITSRFEIIIGVDYSSDIHQVIKIIKEVSEQHPLVLTKPESIVRLINFGNSSIDFSLLFYSNEIFRIEQIKSDIRIKLFDRFKENGIVIPFPQRTIHINKKDQL